MTGTGQNENHPAMTLRVDNAPGASPAHRDPRGPDRRTPNLLAGFAEWRRNRKAVRKRLRRLREADALVVSHPKCGRTWLRAMLSHLYHQRYGLPESELLDADNFHKRVGRIPRVLFTHDGPTEPWNRDRPKALRTFGRKRIVFLARDPRDAAVSYYHHLARRASADERAREGWPDGVLAPPLFDYVALHEGGKLRQVIRYMNEWAELLPAMPQALLVTYEDMRADPHGALGSVTAFLGEAFTAEEIDRAVAFGSFASLREKERSGFFGSFRLRPGDPADPQSYKVRSGKVGGYRDGLTAEQAAVLDAVVAAELCRFYGYARRSA